MRAHKLKAYPMVFFSSMVVSVPGIHEVYLVLLIGLVGCCLNYSAVAITRKAGRRCS